MIKSLVSICALLGMSSADADRRLLQAFPAQPAAPAAQPAQPVNPVPVQTQPPIWAVIPTAGPNGGGITARTTGEPGASADAATHLGCYSDGRTQRRRTHQQNP